MSQRPIVLVAAGGLAREVREAARAAGRAVLGFVDDDEALWGACLDGTPVLGGLHLLDELDADVVLCAGKGSGRQALAGRLEADGLDPARYTTVIHPSVSVPDSCRVGPGSVLLAGCVLTSSVAVGRHVVCMPHVTLTHDDVLEDFATLCAGVTLGGGVRVGEAAYLGMSSCVREQRTVGAAATLGMASALLVDLPAGETWAGQPAARLQPAAPAVRPAS